MIIPGRQCQGHQTLAENDWDQYPSDLNANVICMFMNLCKNSLSYILISICLFLSNMPFFECFVFDHVDLGVLLPELTYRLNS